MIAARFLINFDIPRWSISKILRARQWTFCTIFCINYRTSDEDNLKFSYLLTIIYTNFEISTAVLLANDPETYLFPKIIAINFNLTLKVLSFLFLVFIIFLFVCFGGRGSRTIHYAPPLTLLYLKTEGEELVLHDSLWNNHDVKLQMDVNWENLHFHCLEESGSHSWKVWQL